ncbi:MAG TPA: YciI family protein [Bacteroidota bacterium]|nr:YciI family protein [Bacteroidota bacterium]
MKYLCLIYSDESQWRTMPKEEMGKMSADYFAFTEGIIRSGNFIAGNPLQPTNTATTVRVRNGKLSATDGPFAETKEQLGGYYLIDAKDLNHAIQIAAKIPGSLVGSIEVRPIQEMEMPQPK